MTTIPVGLQVRFDGGAWNTAPYSLDCVAGTQHTIEAQSPQSGGAGIRYVFIAWNDSTTTNPKTITCVADVTYTASFVMQHETTLATAPVGRDIQVDGVTHQGPYSFWCNATTQVTLNAPSPQPISATERARWNSWSDGGAQSHRITCDAPKTVTANFVQQFLITVRTTPVPLNVSVDGVTYASGITFWWDENSIHQLFAPTPQVGPFPGTQYRFVDWTGGPAISLWSVTATASTDYVANYMPQDQVVLASIPTGLSLMVDGTLVTTPATFWWDAFSAHNVVANSPQPGAVGVRYVFAQWSDGDPSPSKSITADAPKTITAMFTTQYLVTLDTDPSGHPIILGGTPYTTPFPFWCNAGEVFTVAVTNPLPSGPSTRYVFSSWSDGDLSTTRVFACTGPMTLTALYFVQYRVMLNAVPTGLDMTMDGIPITTPYATWCTEGSVHVVAVPDPISTGGAMRYRFDGWSDGNRSNPRTFVCSGPMTLTARYVAEYLTTFDTSPTGLQLIFDGVSVTAPQSFWWADGSFHSIAAPSPQYAGSGTRYVFSSWSDGGPRERTLEVTGPATLVAIYAVQFRLIFASPYGSPSCDVADCWYDAGATALLSISPTEVTEGGRRYRFAGWTGDLTAATPGATLIVDGPKNVTAVWEDLGPVPPPGLTPAQWLALGGATFAGVLGAGLALSEPLRFALVLLLVALYTRLRRDDVLDNEKRGMVRGYLAANPGANFAAIRDDLKMATGTLAYHLQVLEREGVVKSWTDGRFKRFALSDHPIAKVEPKLTDIELILLQDLRKRPGRTQRDLAAVAGLSQPTVSYHMEKMTAMGIVAVRREGWRRRYFASLRGPSASAAEKGGDPPGTGPG